MRSKSDPRLSKLSDVQNVEARKIWDEAESDKRREMIVDVAVRLIQSGGRDNASMRRIASEMGVGAMTLYPYIGNRDELYLQIAERGVRSLMAAIASAWEHQDLTPLQRAKLGIKNYLRYAIANPEIYDITFNFPIPEKDDKHSFRRLLPYFSDFTQFTETLLRAANVPEAEIPSRVIYETAIRWAFIHGLAMLCIADRFQTLGLDPEALIDLKLDRLYPELAEIDKNAGKA
ncbi:MAG: TetR/AcrR family transcriptional regulator [Planctomycetota bacterium]